MIYDSAVCLEPRNDGTVSMEAETYGFFYYYTAGSVDWFVSLLVHEEVLLAGLCETKILFQLKIYDRLRQATAKRTG